MVMIVGCQVLVYIICFLLLSFFNRNDLYVAEPKKNLFAVLTPDHAIGHVLFQLSIKCEILFPFSHIDAHVPTILWNLVLKNALLAAPSKSICC